MCLPPGRLQTHEPGELEARLLVVARLEDGEYPILVEPVDEANRISQAAVGANITLRVAGGVGIALKCRSAHQPALSRSYQDIDFVARSTQTRELETLMVQLGYEPEREFNALHGHQRLFFSDRQHQRQVDVFVDAIQACHRLDLRDRLELTGPSLPVADLLLSKLQVVETNEKDYRDAIALLADYELSPDDVGISRVRLRDLCGSDWGWWRTATRVAEQLLARARELTGNQAPNLSHVPDRVQALIDELDSMPKSRRWKMRARIGERVRWYDEPEDIEHEQAS